MLSAFEFASLATSTSLAVTNDLRRPASTLGTDSGESAQPTCSPLSGSGVEMRSWSNGATIGVVLRDGGAEMSAGAASNDASPADDVAPDEVDPEREVGAAGTGGK